MGPQGPPSHSTCMPPSDFLGKRKPKPHSLGLRGLEHFKQMVGDFWRDAGSVVVNQKNGFLTVSRDPDDDPPSSLLALGSRIDRIGHEIVERLLDGDSVGDDGGQGRGRLDSKSDAPSSRLVLIQRSYLLGDLADIGGLQLQFAARDEIADSFDDAPRLLRLRLGFGQDVRDRRRRLATVEHATRAVNIRRQRRKRLADLMGERHGHRRRSRMRRHSRKFRLLFSEQPRCASPFRDDARPAIDRLSPG